MKMQKLKISGLHSRTIHKLGTFFTLFLFSWGIVSCDAGSGVNEDDSIAEETEEINEGLEEQPELVRDDVQNLGNDDEGAVENEHISEEAFNKWDSDRDRRWNSEEFRARVENEGLYENWDTGGDEIFSENEFHGSYFDDWDEDGNEYLNEEEYRTGYRTWRDDYRENFTDLDLNQDGQLDLTEYEAGMQERGTIREWDTNNDGNLTEDEVNTGAFNSWDSNQDGYLEFNEYDEVNE